MILEHYLVLILFIGPHSCVWTQTMSRSDLRNLSQGPFEARKWKNLFFQGHVCLEINQMHLERPSTYSCIFAQTIFKQFFPYFILTFSILPVFFSAFSGGVICISPFFLHVSLSFFYFSTIFSCVTCLSSVCIDWLSGVLRACLTHIQLVCAFPYPLNPYHKDYKSTTS